MLTDFGTLVLRTPIFPYNDLFKNDGTTISLDTLVNIFIQNDIFMEGIYWSSPSLYSAIHKAQTNPHLNPKKRKRLEIAVKKYIIRSCTRATPFGIFAGISAQSIGYTAESQMRHRRVRIDTAALNKIIEAILTTPEFSQYIKYSINNTLYSVGNEFRFLETLSQKGQITQLSSLLKTEILEDFVSKFSNTQFNFQSVYSCYSEYVDKAEFIEFFNYLIGNDFIISELEIDLTAQNDFDILQAFLSRSEIKSLPVTLRYSSLLAAINDYLGVISQLPLGNFAIDEIRKLRGLFKEANILIGDDEPIFHVDLYQNNVGSTAISNQDIQTLLNSYTVLEKTVKANNSSNIKEFIKIYREKYENESVSLSKVLDPDIGVGFPANPNLGHVASHSYIHKSNQQLNQNNNFSEWLWDKVEAHGCNTIPLSISAHDLPRSDLNSALPNVGYLVGRKVAEGKLALESFSTRTAISVLSRFGYMDSKIYDLCRDIASFEKLIYSDKIVADIVWIPNYKIANISRRSICLDYQIPIVYKSSQRALTTVDLSHIMVKTTENEVLIFSKELNKQIVPRLASAHNFHQSSNALYKFLCTLEGQNLKSLSLSAPVDTSQRRFFPRIEFRNIILFPAHWILHETDINTIFAAEDTIAALKDFIKKWTVNRLILLVDNDNELFIDTENYSYLEVLVNEIKDKKKVVFKEWLYDTQSDSQSYATQFIIPVKNQAFKFESTKIKPIPNKHTRRKLIPGSEWIYLKIYCSSGFSDTILEIIYKNVLVKLLKSKILKQFFFIRYMDPHYHLRIRLRMNSTEQIGDVLSLFKHHLQYYVKQDIIWKISMDTYQRELERYGSNNMIQTEKLFFKDSLMFFRSLLSQDIQNPNTRLFSAVAVLNTYLNSFELDLVSKRTLCTDMLCILEKEHLPNYINQVSNDFRQQKELFFNFMTPHNNHLFRLEVDFKNKLRPKNITDYIHMSMNRWFAEQQRHNEYKVYYFATKYYSRAMHDIKSI